MRYDYFNNYFPEQHLGPGRFAPNRNIYVPGDPWVHWNDITPRLAAAYDLFGNGKTALKVRLNKYMTGSGSRATSATTPTRSTGRPSASRGPGTTPTGDFVPALRPRQHAGQRRMRRDVRPELRAAFVSTVYDPETLVGWGSAAITGNFRRACSTNCCADVGERRPISAAGMATSPSPTTARRGGRLTAVQYPRAGRLAAAGRWRLRRSTVSRT